MNEDQVKFEQLWSHVSGYNHHKSECMSAIHDTMLDVLKYKINMRPILDLADRMANRIDLADGAWVFHGTAMIQRAPGEWHITNNDLRFWRDICFFGDRDFFPNGWKLLSHRITESLHARRTWQTLERYLSNGGINGDHRKLLAKLKWDMALHRGGISLYVGGKRPFGNSFIEGDIFEILGWDADWEKWDDEGIDPTEQIERAWELFDELQFAVIDALSLPANQE